MASEIFGFHTGELPTALLDTLFVDLVRVKPANKGTWDNVDYGISHLLKNGDPEKAIQFLENLLLMHSGELTMDVFDSVAREILRNKALISKILTRWFLRGDRVLCEGVHTIIRAHHGDDMPLEIDPAELKPADSVHLLFVEVLTKLGALLFDPLLLNFTGKVRDTVQSMKLILKEYLSSLRERGELDAILPDLLSQLGLNVYSRPGRGTRQDGVDVGAVGSLDDGPEKVYLFSIKPGDLTRKGWDGDSVQSLRPSLNEIIDA